MLVRAQRLFTISCGDGYTRFNEFCSLPILGGAIEVEIGK